MSLEEDPTGLLFANEEKECGLIKKNNNNNPIFLLALFLLRALKPLMPAGEEAGFWGTVNRSLGLAASWLAGASAAPPPRSLRVPALDL